MRIGFTGAHRSGKTTLARLIAAEYDVPQVDSPASGIVKSFGFDMEQDNRLCFEKPGQIGNNTGVSMQWAIYLQLVRQLEEAGNHRGYVSDRTPIDVAAYLLADASGYAGEKWAHDEVLRMVQRSIIDTQRLFDIVILVPPGIDYIAEDGKPGINEAYQEHHHMLCRGILFDEDLDVYWDEIRRGTFSLDARMEFLRDTIKNAMATAPVDFTVAA